ncbi:hypothetical protein F5B20DRAFT_578100 [Whalleya microplaca]|nr:hypothetical protein F5B20DRAFT_578100 [Whalleya microplaca]
MDPFPAEMHAICQHISALDLEVRKLPTMDEFPTKILHAICRHLDRDTIVNFRLTCRIFAEVGAEYIRPKLFMRMTKQHFDKLTGLSQIPHLAQGLRSLEYAPSTYKAPEGTLFEFERAHRDPCFSPCPPIGRYDEYVELVREQHAIQTAHADYSTFRNALSKFPRLKHVTLFLDHCHSDYPHVKQLEEVGYLNELIDRTGSNHMDTFLRVLPEVRLELQRSTEGKLDWQLQSFTAENLDWRFFERDDDATVRKLFVPLSHLQHLRLSIRHDWMDKGKGHIEYDQWRRLLQTGALRESIRPLKQLRSIDIGFEIEDWDWEVKRVASFLDIAPRAFTWPFLRTLKLRCINTDREELMEFLLRHQKTLRELHLEDIGLRRTSWPLLLADIREQLYLTDPCIYGYTEGFDESLGEDEQGYQVWYIGQYDKGKHMYDAIREYLSKGGTTSPGMDCPLTAENMDEAMYARKHPAGL